MESLIYLLDFNEDEMVRKVVMHKRNGGGKLKVSPILLELLCTQENCMTSEI